MGSKCAMTLTLLLATIALVAASGVKQKRSMLYPGVFSHGEEKEDIQTADGDIDVDERELRETAMHLKKTMLDRRGIFDCAEMFQKCHPLKRCCGTLTCKTEGWLRKGFCLKYV